MSAMFPLFQTLGILLDCHDFSEVIESSLYLPLPSGPWDASCQVPQTCLCSGSSDGLESDLLLQWVGLHSPVSALIFRGLRDVGNSVGRENLRKNVAEFIRPLSSMSVVIRYPVSFIRGEQVFLSSFHESHTCQGFDTFPPGTECPGLELCSLP